MQFKYNLNTIRIRFDNNTRHDSNSMKSLTSQMQNTKQLNNTMTLAMQDKEIQSIQEILTHTFQFQVKISLT